MGACVVSSRLIHPSTSPATNKATKPLPSSEPRRTPEEPRRAGDTYRPNPADAVPGKGEDSEMDAAARADPLDFPGAISKDVHQGLGKPAGALAGTKGVSSEARNAATDDAGDPTRRWGRNLSEEMEKRGKGTGSVAYSGAERLPATRPLPSENRPRTPSWGVALGLLWTHKRSIEFPLPQWAGPYRSGRAARVGAVISPALPESSARGPPPQRPHRRTSRPGRTSSLFGCRHSGPRMPARQPVSGVCYYRSVADGPRVLGFTYHGPKPVLHGVQGRRPHAPTSAHSAEHYSIRTQQAEIRGQRGPEEGARVLLLVDALASRRLEAPHPARETTVVARPPDVERLGLEPENARIPHARVGVLDGCPDDRDARLPGRVEEAAHHIRRGGGWRVRGQIQGRAGGPVRFADIDKKQDWADTPSDAVREAGPDVRGAVRMRNGHFGLPRHRARKRGRLPALRAQQSDRLECVDFRLPNQSLL